jgi:uncharacterized protein
MFLLLRLIILIAIILYVIRRVFSGFSRNRSNPEKTDSEQPSNQMVKDPVCGMYMDARLAVMLENNKETLYFCSEKCRTKYLEVSSDAGVGSAAR